MSVGEERLYVTSAYFECLLFSWLNSVIYFEILGFQSSAAVGYNGLECEAVFLGKMITDVSKNPVSSPYSSIPRRRND